MTKKLFALGFVAVLLAVSAAAFTVVRGRRVKADEPAPPADASALGAGANDKGGARVPVVVELFTSEGCSSCPPADALLGRLDATQPVGGAEVIALAQHVDYWNYLGWSDPFSSHEFSERQGQYQRAFGKDSVYTPQMVVDGREELPGGNSGRALEAIARAAREPKAEVSLSLVGDGADAAAPVRLGVRVDKLPRASDGGAAEVLLAITEGGLSSDVERGENSGRKLTHVGVVRRLTKLGEAGAGPFSAEAVVDLEKGWRRENLRAVVFVQEGASRRVVGAASIKLPA